MYGTVVIDWEEDYKHKQVVHRQSRYELSMDWVFVTTKDGGTHLYTKRLVTAVHFHPNFTNKTE